MQVSTMPIEATARLTTILAADVAEYGRLTRIDHGGTLTRIAQLRREVVEPVVDGHHGRFVTWTGDGFLAEFDESVDAVRCAVVIQQTMTQRNAETQLQKRMQFRIAVHFGDILDEPEMRDGDDVNQALCLEGFAEPGGVYISSGVYDGVKDRLVEIYCPLGDRNDNVAPVRVYRVTPGIGKEKSNFRRTALAVAGAITLVGLAGGAYWWQTSNPPAAVVEKPAPAVAVIAKAEALPPAMTVAPAIEPAKPAAVEHTAAKPAPSVPAPEASAPKLAAPALAPAPVPAPASAAPGMKEPAMVKIPGGNFMMGSNEDASEKPIHHVAVNGFAMSKYPVTIGEWRQCVAAHACADIVVGDSEAPVSNVSWSDTQQYVGWLAKETHKQYRLPTEAEWEYAARGGTQTAYWWGNEPMKGMADCKGCVEPYDPHHPVKVGSFKANPYGLHDMTGTVAEWVADCWHRDYQGAPSDQAAWSGGDCSTHVLRGGSWQNDITYARSSSRDNYDTRVRYLTHGFRLALTE